MNREASFTFTTPLNVNIVEIKGEEHLFVEGDISTNDIDMVDDIMTKNCQESMQRQIMERNMKLDVEHEAFKGETHEEKEINKTKIPAGKLIDATVEDLGDDRYSTRVKGEINRHNPNYKQIKGNLLDKYLDAFSVAFLPTEIKYEDREGKEIRLLNDVKLLNIALTGNPCNTKAELVEVFTKSMDAVEEYKRLKKLDPSIEKQLIVKAKNQKENPLSYIWNKMMAGQALDKKELRLLKAAMDVADNKGIYATLAKELFDKISSGLKLSWKEYYIFRELIEVEPNYAEDGPVMLESKALSSDQKRLMDEIINYMEKKLGRKLTKKELSYSTDLVGNSKLNNNKNKMITDKDDPKKPAEGDGEGAGESQDPKPGEGEGESTNDEQKAMLKSVTEEMKSLAEKYDVIQKDNVSMKEDMKEISKNLLKITEALSKSIHKSPGVNPLDAEQKAQAANKSVDPLDAFK